MEAPAVHVYPTGIAKWAVLITAIVGALLELIDTTVVNVTLREMSGSLGATTVEIAWVVTAYAISNVIIIPLTSMLSDLFGRRNYFTFSIIIFTVASFMCGSSTTLWQLVFWRFVQGLGGGALLSTAQTLIIELFPPEKISIANAIFGMGIILGPTFGPTMGGYISDNFSWHWIFFVNIPIGTGAALLSWRYVQNRKGAQRPKKIDWWGIILLVISIGSLQYVLEEGSTLDWFESREIVFFSITAVVGLTLFIYQELHTEHPAVNIRLFKSRNLALGSFLNFVLGLVLFGTVFVFPLFVQLSLGWTATQTGEFFIPGALCTAFAMPIVGQLLSRGVNPKGVIITGVFIISIFCLILSFSSPDSSENNFYLPFVLRGFGMAFMMSPILSLAIKGMKGKDLAQGAGLSNMIRQLGGAVGIALLNVFLSHKNAENTNNYISYVNQYDNNTQDRVAGLTQTYMSAGYYRGDAEILAYKAMNGMVFKQEALVSYNQVFGLISFAVLLCIPIVLLIQHKKGQALSKASEH